MTTESKLYIFGEAAYFKNEDEKAEAKKYLEFWRKQLSHKLNRDYVKGEIIDEYWGERGPEFSGLLSQTSWLYIKVSVKINFRFEVDDFNNFFPVRCLGEVTPKG